MLETTQYIDAHLQDVSVPFLVIHGSDDVVTDPRASQQLHDVAASTDKKLNLYPGM